MTTQNAMTPRARAQMTDAEVVLAGLPSCGETRNHILAVMHRVGGIGTGVEIIAEVVQRIARNAGQAEAVYSHSGRNIAENRVRFSRQRLVEAGLIELPASRKDAATWVLTAEGEALAAIVAGAFETLDTVTALTDTWRNR